MCHACLDPKYQMQEMDRRLASVAQVRQDNDADSAQTIGFWARIGAWLAPWTRKDQVHV